MLSIFKTDYFIVLLLLLVKKDQKMVVLLIFIVSSIFLNLDSMFSNDYQKSVLIPAYQTVNDWNLSPDIQRELGGDCAISLFLENSQIVN